MKTAIILSGYARTWEKTSDSFMKTFGNIDADVFVTTYNKRYGYHQHIKNKTKYFDDEPLDVQDVEKMFECVSPVYLEVEDANVLEEVLEKENARVHSAMHGLNNSLGQARKLRMILDHIQEHERNHGVVYDTIIKTRCDMIYSDNIDFSISDNEVLVDTGNVFPNDCIIVCKKNKFIDVANYMFDEFYLYRNPKSSTVAPHGLLEAAFNNANLNIITRKMMHSVMRVNGEDFY